MWRLSWNLGVSTSRNSHGLPRPVEGLLHLYCLYCFSLSLSLLPTRLLQQFRTTDGNSKQQVVLFPVRQFWQSVGEIRFYILAFWTLQINILVIKPTICTNFSKFIFGIKLYMFRTVPLSVIKSFSLYTQQTCMTYTIAVCTVKNSWWRTEQLSETCRFYSKNKFEKLVYLVGFIIRIYHDARSPERQIQINIFNQSKNEQI